MDDHRYIQLLAFNKEGYTWRDGCVIRFKTPKSPAKIVEHMKDSLAQFEAWAIWNDKGEYDESLSDGLLTRFIKRQEGQSISSIYVMVREGDARYESSVEALRSRLKGPHFPVFHFRDGQILLRWTHEPSQITARRDATSLNRFEHWVVEDSEGFTQTSGCDQWVPLHLDNLYFGDVEEFES